MIGITAGNVMGAIGAIRPHQVEAIDKAVKQVNLGNTPDQVYGHFPMAVETVFRNDVLIVGGLIVPPTVTAMVLLMVNISACSLSSGVLR